LSQSSELDSVRSLPGITSKEPHTLGSPLDFHLASESRTLEEFSLLTEALFDSCHLNHVSREKIITFFSQNQIPHELIPYKKIENYCDNLISIRVDENLYNKETNELESISCLNQSMKKYAGRLKILNFIDYLKFIVKKNLHQLQETNKAVASYFLNLQEPFSGVSSSFLKSKHYFELWRDTFDQGCVPDIQRITLVINIDDARMIKSKNFAATPVSASIAELPSSCRNMRDDIMLLAFYWGVQKIDYQVLCKKVLKEIFEKEKFHQKPFELILDQSNVIWIMIRIGVMILDAPARSSFLSNMQWNSPFGCATCTYRATSVKFLENSIPKTKICFAYRNSLIWKLLSSEYEHKDELYSAAETVRQDSNNYMGIKKTPVMLQIIKNLNRSCLIDPMHCVDEGISKELAEKMHLYKKTTK